MDKSIFSSSWYRVAHLKSRLRSHAKIHRQQFRGHLWYVLQDTASGRYHRFSPPAHLLISLMDGYRTLQEIWDIACRRLGDDVLTQDETIRLLAQLHQSDLLRGDVPPDVTEMTERAEKQRRRKLVMSLLNPLALRVPLLDPERFLAATMPLVRPLFGWFGIVLFAAVIGSGMVLAVTHWPALTENIADRLLVAESLLLLVITYPIVKALHELGHGYAVKNWGGEVHELGVMFLVFMPVPYVDASASSAFREKWRRALVGAAGILVELFLASIALFAWLNIEPGLPRAFLFNVMLIGGVSTLLFNGNPLLRFDGYYVLSDLIEIPNLGPRSNRYIGYFVQRYLFGVRDAVSPVSAPGEAGWLACYGLAAFVYRLFIMAAIILFVATKFFIVGVILAVWAVTSAYAVPLAKGIWYLVTSPALRRQRVRAIGVTLGFLLTIGGVLFLVPAPHGTVAEGIVWTPGTAAVHARTEGVVTAVLGQPEHRVLEDQPLFQLEDPFLAARVRALDAQVRELSYRLASVDFSDQVEANIIEDELEHARAELALFMRRDEDLLVASPGDGQFVLPISAVDLPGRFVEKGELLGYVADLSRPIVRVLLSQDVVDLVRNDTESIEVRLAGRVWQSATAVVDRETPLAVDQLPSMALSTAGGGLHSLDPNDPSGNTVLETLFQLDLRFDPPIAVTNIGGRAYVRFDHGTQSLARQMYRGLRQLFLRHFDV